MPIVPKQAYNFVKNVMLDLTQSFSKVSILSDIYMLIFDILAYYMYFFCIDSMFFFVFFLYNAYKYIQPGISEKK